MDIEVKVLNSASRKLELHITGEGISVQEILIAFQDGLRNHAKGVLTDVPKSIRKAETAGYVLTCYPFYSDKRERDDSTICYELKRELRNPIKTSH